MQDVNRYFSSFTDQLFSKDTSEEGAVIREDTIALYPASTYQVQAEIQSAMIREGQMEVVLLISVHQQ